MSIVVAVRTCLLADSQVASLVGTRAYAKKLPQNVTYPALTIEIISGDPGNVLNAVGTLKQARIRINSWGTSYANSETLAIAVEAALNGNSGTYSGVRLASITAQGLRDFYEPEVQAYYHTQDFSIFYQ